MTGRELFEAAMDVCGLRETDGSVPGDALDLEQRAPALINLLLADNAWLDSRIKKQPPQICVTEGLESVLDVSEIVARSVLPYGLAALLTAGEDDALCARLSAQYESARELALRSGRAAAEEITEVYG